MIADNKKKDSVIEELMRTVEEGKKTTAELIMVIDLLERHQMIYENPHARRPTAACLRNRRRCVLHRRLNPQSRPKTRQSGFRAASPVIPASYTTGDQRKQYTTSRANMTGAAAPASQMYAPLPSR